MQITLSSSNLNWFNHDTFVGLVRDSVSYNQIGSQIFEDNYTKLFLVGFTFHPLYLMCDYMAKAKACDDVIALIEQISMIPRT